MFQSSNAGDQTVRLLHPDGQYRDKKLAPGDRLLVHISDITKYGGHFQIIEDVRLPESTPIPVQPPAAPGVFPTQVSSVDDEFAKFVRERAAAIRANAQKAPPPRVEPDVYQQAAQEFMEATEKPAVEDDKSIRRRVTKISKKPK